MVLPEHTVLVYAFSMSTFQQALSEWLRSTGTSQTALAEAVGTTQASINRYATGERVPLLRTAQAIVQATGGAVSFEAWQSAFNERRAA